MGLFIFIAMLTIKRLLREGLFNKETDFDKISDFVTFAKDYLEISKGSVSLEYDRSNLTTTAAYGNKKIMVYVKERALVDVMRSIAHELVHLKQDVEGRLKQTQHAENNAAGSPIENEANAVAGVLIRLYGQKHREIYE